ncbi:polymer-forming cytoskeletal protein [Xanthomonas floridensis]|uniref:Polymer-forming cytoskeletal protein n=1 Tax=Xanthomonas floridensis TaxID=1843580 RepID=A0A1A9MBK9_9XANT|nr:polymer-forming cytoskeletal protein [Xanthomonas floridensis]MEA5122582.1 polymer-forming cytoskeletal protein [Xanthomonas floridensis]MEA5134034.1 polymer-forming cytoskeletal protein [Xanthomonas floridensis]OAG67904.1 hypothetical protein A7D17_01675 [Xanthomonas floridensis]
MDAYHDAVSRYHDSAPNTVTSHALHLLDFASGWQLLEGPQHVACSAWRPPAAFVVIDGDLHVDGNLIVATGRHDQGALIVLGNVQCRNVVTGHDHHLAISGDLVATEAVVACLGDSTTQVGGNVHADTVISGAGAWLTLASADAFQASRCDDYVMIGQTPSRPVTPTPLTDLVVDAVLDRGEWDAMDADDRDGEDIGDYVVLDESAALAVLAKGQGILRT